MRVYADNAATTKLSPAAKEAMLPYFDEIYGNPSTLYTLGQEAAEHLLACRTEIAQLIGAADPREIVFTSGGSEADNQAIISAARNGARKGKKHLISTKFEHHAVLHTLDKLRKEGFDVTLLDVHENGVVRVEDVAAAIRDDTALVSVMFANNEIGTIQPIEAIGALCRERGIPFHTDAVQAIGLPHEVAHGSLRLSVGEYNTDEEMAYIVDNVRQVVAYLRSISPVWDELETGARPHLI